jgi:hypothetical protein
MAHIDGRTAHDTHPAAAPLNGTDARNAPVPTADRAQTVTLQRLLGLATLTPPQAVHIAGEVLGRLDGSTGNGADTDAVAVGEDGSVRLLAGRTRGDLDVTAELVDQLTRNADRPVARRNPASARLLAALTRSAAALRDGDLVAARAALVPSARTAGLDEQQARKELAALVAIPLRPTAAVRRLEIAEPKRVPTEPRPVRAAPQPPRRPTRSRRRLITTIVIVALAVVGVVSTIALVQPGGSGSNNGPTTSPTTPPNGGSHASQHRSAPGPNHRRTIPTLAPAQARAISKVTLTPVARCRGGAACAVTVRVWLRPPWLSGFHWHAAVVNRCTHSVRQIAAGTMIARPGWRSAYNTVQFRLPNRPRLALIAVVDRPVSAASRALLVTTGPRGCG